MKKFSSSVNKDEVKVKVTTTTVDETLSNIIDENVNVQFACECYATKKMVIEGKSDLIADVLAMLEEESTKSNKIIVESLQTKFINVYDHNVVSRTLSMYEDAFYSNMLVVSPIDVFHEEDYEKIADGIRLTSLTNIPDVFVDYILVKDSNKYFSAGNYIDITHRNNKWCIDLDGDIESYGDSTTPTGEKREMFVVDNKDFIDSFIDAVTAFIGDSNLISNQVDIL